jgi:nucleotide-binding universal stress UspA family protein
MDMSKGDKSDPSILPIKKILVAVDRTALSIKAANYGIHLAEVEQAKLLVIMHVVEDVKQGGTIGLRAKYGDVKLVEGFRKAKVDSAEELIRPIEVEAKKKGVNVKSEIVYTQGKSVVKSILEYARNNDIDLIVIGGGDVSKKYLLVGGSVANAVIKKSQCPVIVVR